VPVGPASHCRNGCLSNPPPQPLGSSDV
jgi:hypothetical protein